MKKQSKWQIIIAAFLILFFVNINSSAQCPVDFTSNSVACIDSEILFEVDTITTNVSVVSTWNWDFGDGNTSNLQNPVHTYLSSGNYNVTLTILTTTGCSSQASHPTLILPAPGADFSYSNQTCSMILFSDLSTAPTGYFIIEWNWDFGDGFTSSIQNPSHIYSSPGIYNVSLVVRADSTGYVCTDTVSYSVQTFELPTVFFTWNPEPTSLGDQTDFFGTSGNTITTWYWDFDDGNFATTQNASHTFATTGTFNVELTVTDINGCDNTIIHQVSVTDVPALDFTWNYGCEGEPVQFTVLSPPTDIPAVLSWSWLFGDGGTSTEMEPTHIYTATGTYDVSLTIIDTTSTTNTLVKQITINLPPVSAFSSDTPACTGNSVQFTDNSTTPTGYITEWHWDFGDGTSQTVTYPNNPNVSHIYSNSGTYIVALSITNSDSCTSSSQNSLTITPGPIAGYTYQIGCTDDPVLFTDLSTQNGGSAITSWYWDFGDPASGTNDTSTNQNPTHLFSSPGSYNVVLVVTNFDGCTDSITQICLLEEINIDFTTTNDCFGLPTLFTATYAPQSDSIISYTWNFNDGSPLETTIHNTILHTFPSIDVYEVELSVIDIDGCTDYTSHFVSINALPDISLSASLTTTTTNTPIQFYGSSIDSITSWLYDFNDGNTSTLQNPIHSYQYYNTYDVTLNVVDINGCTNTDTTLIQIITPPVFPDSLSIWNTLGYSFGTQEWRFRFGLIGDTTISNTKDTSFVYSKLYELYDSTLSMDNAIYSGAIRTTNDKVYLKLPELPETILYDFSVDVGDTIWYNVGGHVANGNAVFEEQDHFKVVTNKDSTLLLDNNYHTRWYLQGQIMNETWVEGVGSTTWFGLLNPIITDIATNGDSYSLACFKQNGNPLFIDNPDCDKCFCYLLTEINEINFNEGKEICIYPNPTSTIVNISTSFNSNNIVDIKVYNSLGNCVYQYENLKSHNTSINVRNWGKGLYVVIVSCNGKLIGTNEIVIN